MDGLAGRLVRRLRSEPEAPTLVSLEDEEADRLFDALASETSRAVLMACYDDGHTRSELAERLETSVQNVGYHVDKLETAGVLEESEIRYGENGREVVVYEPTKRAVVIAAGEQRAIDRLAAAVDRLFAPLVVAALLSTTVGILARGPGRIGMLADDAATRASTAVGPELVSLIVALFLGVVLVVVADQLGAFERSPERRPPGLRRVLLGRRIDSSRRYVLWTLALALGTLIALDMVAVGAGHRVTVAAWLAVQFAIPASIFVAAAVAYTNDGLFVSWAATSAPVVGLWGYLLAGDLLRGGFEPVLVALGPVAVGLLATPLGSVAYLLGRLVAGRRGRAPSLSRRTTALLVAHPLAVGCLFGGWLLVVS